VRVYSNRYSNGIRTSTCRDNCGAKLNCCVSWHCMFHIPGLHVYRLTQGHRGEWVSLLSHFSACFKTLVTKPSCFVCSADKDTTLYVSVCVCVCMYILYIYRVSPEECARLREGVHYVKVYRYNPKHLCPKLNGYGDKCPEKFETLTAVTHLLITKYILKLAGICGFCNVNICT